MGVVVAVHQAGAAGHEDVAPAVFARRDPQRARGHRLGEGHVEAQVVARRVGQVHLGLGIGLEAVGDGLQVFPEFVAGRLGHVPVSLLLWTGADSRGRGGSGFDRLGPVVCAFRTGPGQRAGGD